MFGEKRAGPDRGASRTSGVVQSQRDMPRGAPLSARRGADSRRGPGPAAVRCPAQPYLAMVSGALRRLAWLSSPRVVLVCREIPYLGSADKLCRRLCIRCASRVFWSIANFFFNGKKARTLDLRADV